MLSLFNGEISPRHCTRTVSLQRSICAVSSLSTTSIPFQSCALAHFKIVSSKTSKACITRVAKGYLSSELWDEIERTMSDFLAYDGVRQWWETRKHWHTEAFVGVVEAIIARGDQPTAYSTYNLTDVVLPKDG